MYINWKLFPQPSSPRTVFRSRNFKAIWNANKDFEKQEILN